MVTVRTSVLAGGTGAESWGHAGSWPGTGSLAHTWRRDAVKRGYERQAHCPYSRLQHLVLYTEQWFSECGSQTSPVTWELIRHANYLAPAQAY